jgi:MFS family permease
VDGRKFKVHALKAELVFVGTAADRSRFKCWGWTTLLTICLAMSFVHRGLLSILIGPIEKDMGLTDLQLGEVQGPAFTVLFAMASIVFGRGADLINRRVLLGVSITLLILGAVVISFAGSFVSLFVGRMAVGAGAAAVMPLGASLIPDLFDRPRLGLAFGVFLAGAVLGDAFSVVFGGWTYELLTSNAGRIIGTLAPWREVVLLAIIPLILLLPFVIGLEEPMREHRPRESADGRQLTTSISFLVENWRIYLPYALAMTSASVLGAASYWVPEVLRRDYGMTPAEIAGSYGATLTVSSLLGAALGILAGRVSQDAVRGFLTTAVAYAVTAFALLAFLSNNSNYCLVAIGLFVVLDAATSVVLMTSIQSVTPPTIRGVTASLDRLFGVSLGYSIGQPLVGWLANQLHGAGVRLASAMLIVAVPAGAVASILLLVTATAARRGVRD